MPKVKSNMVYIDPRIFAKSLKLMTLPLLEAKRNVNFMVKLKVSRIYPSLPLLQGIKKWTKENFKVGKSQGAMWASHPTISSKINTT